MAETRDYSSIYSIKDFAINTLAPKYFDLADINQLNVGLLGYTTELIANTTEDGFNAVSTFINEMFPNKAKMPESIYNYAALFQEEDLFAKPAEMGIMLFINENDIVKLGKKKDSYIEFILDSELIIDVEGQQFMMDYNIILTAKPSRGDYIYTAMYDMNFINTLSDISNPYIKIRRVKYSNSNYLGIMIKVRQMNRFTLNESIINNDKINLPSIPIEFNDKLANFEVFYKSPESSEYIQLVKRLASSSPLKTPFCYYKFTNSQEMELLFSSRDNYFKPKFNSEILIYSYTTKGVDGVFPLYKGTNISVIPKSDVYDYNNSVVLFAVVQTESRDGRDSMTLDELQNLVVEKFSTVGSYTTESDLQLYFSNYKYRYGNEMLFVKKRDDISRLFSAFALLKDQNKDIYPTNTLHMELQKSDMDEDLEQSDMYVLKPGRLFKYKESSKDTVVAIAKKTINDDLTIIDEDFIYTLPFLMVATKNPTVVGFYLNSLSSKNELDYSYVNTDSSIQFICNSLSVSRNSLIGENRYKLSLILTPALTLESPLVDPDTGLDLGILKIKGMIEDSNIVETCFVDFTLKNFDPVTMFYTFEAFIETDDYVGLNQKFRVIGINDILSQEPETKMIPMSDCKINIYAFYKYDDHVINHQYSYMSDLSDHTLTNIYSTIDSKVNFITPLNIIRSQMKYINNGTDSGGNTLFSMLMSFVPFVKAESMKNPDVFTNFLSNLFLQYNYMQNVLDKITSNCSIDLKFYNTFGKSKNFTIGEDGILLDRVNCSVQFNIRPNIGTVNEDLIRDLKIFIKGYVESVNTKGSNGIFISNLITSIENNFPNVKYQKFGSINEYESKIQVIENITVDMNLMSKDDRKNFVPEYLTLSLDDIHIDIIQ